jgi:hypothetical protein
MLAPYEGREVMSLLGSPAHRPAFSRSDTTLEAAHEKTHKDTDNFLVT